MSAIITELADQSLECGEGPVWDPHRRRLFWTDSGGTTVFSLTEGANEPVIVNKGLHVASLTLHANGGLMLCGAGGFHHLGPDGEIRIVADTCEGRALEHINDIIADPIGRVFGGQEKFHDDQPYEPGFLYRVGLSGDVSIVEEGLHIANGMGFSPDLSTFYLVDTIPRHIYAYDYHLADGSIANRRVLITLGREEGLPDGMTVDREGFLWVARWFGNGISRYDPDGKLERKIDLPAAQTSSLTFGGKDMNEIFVTSAATFWQSDMAPEGHDFQSLRGGSVYKIVHDIVGLPEYQARAKKEL
jgi:sugar lactone lactonase YvrE